jgi:hypothetical protein
LDLLTGVAVTEMSVPTNCGRQLGSSFDERPSSGSR